VRDFSQNIIKANWLNLTTEHSFKEISFNKETNKELEEIIPHPFYDLEFNGLSKKIIQYYPVTLKNSPIHYDFDLLSGNRYKVRNYCKFSDTWKAFRGDLELPNYTEGIVPRVFDQQKKPMKIIVFSEEVIQYPKQKNVKFFESAKILGSVLIEECDSYPCNIKEKWRKSQVLVAVGAEDTKLSKFENLNDLKAEIDWEYAKAYLVNNKGAHQLGNNFLPAFRIVSELGGKESIDYFEKNSTVIDFKNELIARESCINLQDEIWNDFLKIKKLEHFQKDKFKDFLIHFIMNQKDQFSNCDRIVRSSNINISHEKHWFFAFLSLFTNLEKEGLYYNCSSSGWFFNPKLDDGKFYVSQVKEIEKCSEKDVEKSFDQAINALGSMKNQLNKYYKYIEYDSGQGGSNEKIYNWIKFDNRKLSCEPIKSTFDFFPQDVVWQQLKDDEEKVVH